MAETSMATVRPKQGAWARGMATIKRAIADARTRRRLRRELDDLTEYGLIDDTAKRFGLSPFGLRRVVSLFPGAMRRYAGMTRRLGLGAKLSPAAGISDMLPPHRRCIYCRASGVCEHWLRTEGELAEAEQFCPNSAEFARRRSAS